MYANNLPEFSEVVEIDNSLKEFPILFNAPAP